MLESNYYKVGGSLEYQHPTYVVRQADAQLYRGLMNGEFCYVLNSRQMGKSSLRVQMTKKLKAQGVKCAAIDMTRIGSHVTPEEWYGGLVSELLRGFRLSRKINFSNWWRDRSVLSPVQRLSEFIDDVLLIELSETIVIFIDEIDSIIKIPFRDDFFAFIRACYNQRVDNPDYQRLTFCLLGVATPSDLIASRTLSTPFNIGTAIELTGFHLDKVDPLVQGLEPIVSHPRQVIAEVLEWTGGQPFLTQKLCKLIVQESDSDTFKSANGIEALVRENIIENWEACDEPEHLRTIRDRIKWSQRQKPLLRLYQQILQQGDVKAKDTPEQMELRLSGLVVKQQSKLRVANRIYQAIFDQTWLDELLTEAGIVPEITPATVPNSVPELEQVEQMAQTALQQFNYKQIEALNLALQAGYTLKGKIKTSRRFSDLPNLSPLFALQKILHNIYERNRFSTGQGMVQDVSFSPDGECLVTAGGDGTVKLWNRFGQLLREWQGHQSIIYDVSFSNKGQFIATAGRDGMAKVWQISGKKITQVSSHQGSISTVSFSPDDSQILTVGRDGMAKLWNLSGENLAQFKSRWGTIWAAQFSTNGQYIATAGTSKWDGLVTFWNQSGEPINQVKSPKRPILSLNFSPDGKFMATAHHDGTVQLWNLSKQQVTLLNRHQNDGQQVVFLNRHQQSVRSICFSPDSKRLATVSGGIARVWNLSGQLLAQLNENLGAVLGLSFSPNSQRLATAGADGNVRFWDLSQKHLTEWNTDHGTVDVIRFTPSKKYIFTVGADGKICLWNINGKQLAQLDDPQRWVKSASFSPEMHYLVTAGAESRVRLWVVIPQFLDAEQQALIASLELKNLLWQIKNLEGLDYQIIFLFEFEHSTRVNCVSWSSDRRIATAGADGCVCIWDLFGRQLTQLKTHQKEVKSVSFHPDNQRIATVGADNTVCIWNISGRYLAHWQTHQGETTSVSCSPDGQSIATAGTDGTVKLWTISGQLLAEFKSHQGAIRSVSFSENGKGIATAGDEGSVQLWRVEGLEELLARGDDWLEDYWVTYPDALRQLEACKNRVNSSAVELNQTETRDREETPNETFTQPISGSLSFSSEVCDNLPSEVGIDYRKLRDFLKAGQWREADAETTKMMLIAARCTQGFLKAKDIQQFPCTDLLTIDQLWRKYSNERFGFSIQKTIWESLRITENSDYAIYYKLPQQIGWRHPSGFWRQPHELSFRITDPVGNLPSSILNWLWSNCREVSQDSIMLFSDIWWDIPAALVSRLTQCHNQCLAQTPKTPQRLVTQISESPQGEFLGEFTVNHKFVRVYHGDITNLVTDVMVSSDDTNLKMNGALSWRISQVGGNEIYHEAQKLSPCPLGTIAITTAGKLQAKKIFHAAVIDWYKGLFPSRKILRQVVHTCLNQANQYGFKSIVFPLLGTGGGSCSKQVAWDAIVEQLIQDLSTNNQSISEVVVAVYKLEDADVLKIKQFLKNARDSDRFTRE